MPMTKPHITEFGDGALLLTIAAPNPDALPTQQLRSLAASLSALDIFEEIVPAYDSLMVEFDPQALSQDQARKALKQAFQAPVLNTNPTEIIEIPVAYGEDYGPDLAAAKTALSLTADEIISLHCGKIYDVVMLGFIPGFCFLSAVDTRLQMPRHSAPRANVPPGSVGIANWQTGIYGLQSPGGWQIIGRTPMTLFDIDALSPSRLQAGDRVRFKAISSAQFNNYKAQS